MFSQTFYKTLEAVSPEEKMKQLSAATEALEIVKEALEQRGYMVDQTRIGGADRCLMGAIYDYIDRCNGGQA